MKLTTQQVKEIIDAVVDQLEYEVDANGYHEYDIYSFVPKEYEENVKKMIEKTMGKNNNKNMSNALQEMFELQRELQKKIKFNTAMTLTQYIRLMFIGIVTEASEALEEVDWKPWKKARDNSETKFKEEIVDIWHFLINLTMASSMGPAELVRRFKAKNKINVKRQEKHY